MILERRIFAIGLSVVLLAISVFSGPVSADGAELDTDFGSDVSAEEDNGSLLSENGYNVYFEQYKEQPNAADNILLTERVTENVRTETVDGREALVFNEAGVVTYTFSVPSDALYNLQFEYYPVSGRGSDIERNIEIDGKTPFEELASLSFLRIYKDEVEYDNGFTFDNRGNEIRPPQVEAPMWLTLDAADKTSYYPDPFLIFLTAGSHTLTIREGNEELALGSAALIAPVQVDSYEDTLAGYKANGLKEKKGQEAHIIEGENALYKSDSTLFAGFDRSSPGTSPFSATKILLNTIGGARFKYPGQWISWKTNVTEEGLYRIAVRARQNIVSGQQVTRRIYINGQLPFKEAGNLGFPYTSKWQMYTLGDTDGEYLFHLKPGDVITLEASLGDMADILREVQESIYNLNYVYRQILMITGPYPDTFRDYDLSLRIPEALKMLEDESSRLRRLVTTIENTGNQSGSYVSTMNQVIVRVDNMLSDIKNIPKKFTDFQRAVTALGSWFLSAKEQPLEIDYIAVLESGSETPAADVGFFTWLTSSIKMFLASFFNDYNQIGNMGQHQESIDVWLATGRDQANIIKQLCENDFTEKHNIGVNVRLVAAGSLLPAILTGKGLDVYLSAAANEPMNYGMRKAVRKLNDLPGFDEVKDRFYESALTPYTYNGDVYALPETQTFPLLFYRKDIFESMGVGALDTWEDVYNVIPELAKKNMKFGIPAYSSLIASSLDLTMYWTLLYQLGGTVYSPDYKTVAIDSPIGVDAFKQWSGFYTNYSLYHTYDFATSFRSGLIPVAIADYTNYNLLSVFAPEIQGLWDIAPVPGTRKADGSIDRTVFSGGTATEMIATTKKVDEAWTFMKWWCESGTQVSYGKELESIMGTSARYPVSNKEALDQMPWTTKQAATIRAQWENTRGVPEVPGGYLKDREINFALRAVLLEGAEPREALTDHIYNINLEIEKMRKEFKLD